MRKFLYVQRDCLSSIVITEINMLTINSKKFNRLNWCKIRTIKRYIFKDTYMVYNVFYNKILNPTAQQIDQILFENNPHLVAKNSGIQNL